MTFVMQPERGDADNISSIGALVVVVQIESVTRMPQRVPEPLGSMGLCRRVFDAFPQSCLIMDRDLRIVDFNSTYERLAMVDRSASLGRNVFDVFPPNPDDPNADGMKNATASFAKVLNDKVPHQMPFQRYDIRNECGVYIERYWKPTNCPILDNTGKVEYILQTVEDVTAIMKRFKPLFTPPKL